jgi:hypothetical protein
MNRAPILMVFGTQQAKIQYINTQASGTQGVMIGPQSGSVYPLSLSGTPIMDLCTVDEAMRMYGLRWYKLVLEHETLFRGLIEYCARNSADYWATLSGTDADTMRQWRSHVKAHLLFSPAPLVERVDT